MSADDPEPTEGAPTDERRRLRQAELEAADEHGRQLLARYGRMDYQPRYAVVGHANAKRRRR